MAGLYFHTQVAIIYTMKFVPGYINFNYAAHMTNIVMK